MNCNPDAFNWIIKVLKVQSSYEDLIVHARRENLSSKVFLEIKEKHITHRDNELCVLMQQVDTNNCLNILVTCYFLKTDWIYQKIWDEYLQFNFSEVINNCKISLSNMNPGIINDIAVRVSEQSLENLIERKDKFISKVYQERTEVKILGKKKSSSEKKTTENKSLEDDSKQSEQSNQLYWCETCKRLFTPQHLMNISCVESNSDQA